MEWKRPYFQFKRDGRLKYNEAHSHSSIRLSMGEKLVITLMHCISLVQSTRLRWTGHVAKMEEGRSAFKILTGKPTGNRPLDRPRRR